MTYLDQSHTGIHGTARRSHTPERVGGTRYLSVADAILLAAIALAGYVGSELQSNSASQPAAGIYQPPAKESLCSSEELRHMRSSPDTCYDEPGPYGNKSDLAVPSSTFNNT